MSETGAEKRWPGRPRLRGFTYDGEHAYHIVFSTSYHKPLLVGEVAVDVQRSVIAAAFKTEHELLAYVIMPNHVHALVQGQSLQTDVVRFVQLAKQGPAFRFKKRTGNQLWLRSFYDRIVRRGDDAREIAAYIIANPSRTGLLTNGECWPYSGGTLVEQAIGRS